MVVAHIQAYNCKTVKSNLWHPHSNGFSANKGSKSNLHRKPTRSTHVLAETMICVMVFRCITKGYEDPSLTHPETHQAPHARTGSVFTDQPVQYKAKGSNMKGLWSQTNLSSRAWGLMSRIISSRHP